MDTAPTSGHGHIPVMSDRMVELMIHGAHAPAAPATPIILDATVGAGGHSEAFLEAIPQAIVVGLDRDPHALEEACSRLAHFGSRFIGVRTRFDGISGALEQLNAQGVFPHDIHHTGLSGFLCDLGVSSMQLDQAPRGFAYSVDAPLDMRMDPDSSLTAAEILNTYSHGDLARILKTYGEERFAGKLASAIVREREKQPFVTSARLVDLIYSTIPAAARRTGGHPAKRTFQALRIEVNAELEALDNLIPLATAWLHIGGVGVFMSYQSLEDKAVKKALVEATTSQTPLGLPMDLPDSQAEFEFLTRGAEKASAEEIERNPRASPVRVRAARRITIRGQSTFPVVSQHAPHHNPSAPFDHLNTRTAP